MENIKIGLQIDSNTKSETADAKKLHDQLKQAADAAGKIKVGGVAKAAAQPAAGAMASAQPTGSQAIQQYGAMRGTAGATGASARDFANQAQGLSGLVRLYAIYAANVYAVTAAFNALSRAMDTTNMIRGLDQIGAASGVALGGLSKQLVTATGGAISLREAMSATVKVTAAGLGSENVLRLGQVAAKASQALGVDMGDAINRLSRGITKLEPELLDELGIFTKIDPAVQKYALSVGKSASQLTDFERRQAFANAVLEEGEKKFAAIKVDANPYNKLAASLQNIAQNGLELVNKVLGPIVNLLSSSPATLVTILSGLGLSLISKVIPALKELGTTSRKSADEALAILRETQVKAQGIRDEASKVTKARLDAALDSAVAKADAAERRLKSLQTATAAKTPEGVILTSQKAQIDPNDPTVKNAISGAYLRARELAAQGDKEGAKALKDLADQTKAYGQDLDNLQKQQDRTKQSNEKIIASNEKVARSLEVTAWKNNIAEQTRFNASVGGISSAYTILRAEIDKNELGLTRLQKASVYTGAAFSVLAGKAAVLGGALLSAFSIISAIIGITTLLVSVLSNTKKESEATSQAFGQLEESTKNLANSVDVLNKKAYLEQFNVESVNAKANALEGFTSALQKTNEAAQTELAAMNGLDRAVDIVKMIWGGDVQSRLNKETAYGLSKAFSSAALTGSPSGQAAKKAIADILKIDPSQVSDLEKTSEALGKLSSAEKALAIAQINDQLDKLAKTNRNAATAINGLEEGFKKISEARKKFTSELIPKDTFTEFGTTLISTSFELAAALKNPTVELETIKRTFEELKSIGGIPVDLLVGLQDAAKKAEQLQVLTRSLEEADVETDKLTNRLKLLEKAQKGNNDFVKIGRDWFNIAEEISNVSVQLDNLGKYKTTNLKVKLDLEQSINQSRDTINQAQIKVFETGSQIVSSKLSAEFAKAGQTVTNAFAGLLSGTDAGLKLRAQSEKAMLAVQLQQIKTQELQIRAIAANTLALREDALQKKLAEAASKENSDLNLATDIINLQEEIKGLKQALEKGGTFDTLAKKRAQDLKTTGQSGITAGTLQLASSLEGSRAAQAQIASQFYATDLKLSVDLLTNEQKRTQEEKSRNLDRLKAARELSLINKDVFNQTNESALLERQRLDTQIRGTEETLRQLDADNRIAVLNKIRAETEKQLPAKTKEQQEEKAGRLKDIDVEIGRVQSAKEQSAVTAALKEQAQLQQDSIELVKLRGQVELEALAKTGQDSERRLAARAQELDIQQRSFDILARTIQLSPEYVAAEEEILARKRAQLEFDKQRQQLEQTRSKALIELSTQEQTLGTTEEGFAPGELEAIEQIRIKREEINIAYAEGIALQTQTLTLAEREAVAKKALADEQNKYNLLLTQTQSVGDSLKGIFEGLGSSADKFAQGIGNFVNTFAEVGIQAEKNAEAVSKWQQTLSDPDLDPQDRAKAENELGKARAKQTKDELSGNIKLVSSAKSLFKEKSTGYKVLGAIEKAMHIAKLAMAVKEMFFDTANTAKSVANSATRGSASVVEAGIDGVKAVVKAISSLPFPANLLAGAVTAAAVGGLLSKIGGDKPSVSGGGGAAVTAEQRQETQGTAMGYNAQGEKVRVREGVFGDTSAKSESIANSLEIIKDNSVKGLEYDDKLLKSFEKLAKSIETAAGALYSTRGITTGSAFDTQEGTRGTSFLGISLSKTTTAIIDSGIRLSGSFLDLANKTGGVIEGFETVQTTRKRLIGKTKTSVDTQGFGLDTATVRAIEDSFASAADIIYELGGEIGIGVNNITNALQNVPVNELVSLRGLKGKELQEQLQAVLGSVIDEAAFKVFGTLATTYRKFGEGALETVVRVVDTNRKIEQQLGNIRGTGTALELGFEVTEALADAAGGLQSFIEKTDGFIDKFLTDAEKLVPTQLAVSRGLDKLGLGWVKTKDQFKQVAQSLDVTTDYGRETFVALMNISEGFDEVATAAEKAFESVKNELKSVAEQRISELKGARDEMQGFAKSLREYQSSLKTGSLSPLTPQQQYEELKREFLTTQQRAMGGDAAAMAKLSAAGSSFLQASQRMFASSDEYVSDFDLVSSSIDSAASFAEQQVGIANQTLAEIKNVVGALVELKVETEKVPVALSGFGTALSEALAKYTISKAAMGAAFETGGIRKYALGGVVNSITPFRHMGGLGVMGEAGPEAIMPLKRMPGGNLGVTMGGNFGEQLAKLNQQVAELTQVVANGAVMNAQATDRNTDAVVAAVGNTAETMEYKNKLTSRMQIV